MFIIATLTCTCQSDPPRALSDNPQDTDRGLSVHAGQSGYKNTFLHDILLTLKYKSLEDYLKADSDKESSWQVEILTKKVHDRWRFWQRKFITSGYSDKQYVFVRIRWVCLGVLASWIHINSSIIVLNFPNLVFWSLLIAVLSRDNKIIYVAFN